MKEQLKRASVLLIMLSLVLPFIPSTYADTQITVPTDDLDTNIWEFSHYGTTWYYGWQYNYYNANGQLEEGKTTYQSFSSTNSTNNVTHKPDVTGYTASPTSATCVKYNTVYKNKYTGETKTWFHCVVFELRPIPKTGGTVAVNSNCGLCDYFEEVDRKTHSEDDWYTVYATGLLPGPPQHEWSGDTSKTIYVSGGNTYTVTFSMKHVTIKGSISATGNPCSRCGKSDYTFSGTASNVDLPYNYSVSASMTGHSVIGPTKTGTLTTTSPNKTENFSVLPCVEPGEAVITASFTDCWVCGATGSSPNTPHVVNEPCEYDVLASAPVKHTISPNGRQTVTVYRQNGVLKDANAHFTINPIEKEKEDEEDEVKYECSLDPEDPDPEIDDDEDGGNINSDPDPTTSPSAPPSTSPSPPPPPPPPVTSTIHVSFEYGPSLMDKQDPPGKPGDYDFTITYPSNESRSITISSPAIPSHAAGGTFWWSRSGDSSVSGGRGGYVTFTLNWTPPSPVYNDPVPPPIVGPPEYSHGGPTYVTYRTGTEVITSVKLRANQKITVSSDTVTEPQLGGKRRVPNRPSASVLFFPREGPPHGTTLKMPLFRQHRVVKTTISLPAVTLPPAPRPSVNLAVSRQYVMMTRVDEQNNPVAFARPQNPDVHVDAALENAF